MKTTRGLDRLVFFTDAVTAIAITLLAAFGLSFVVIAR
jgi:uncharacterized membrane protein